MYDQSAVAVEQQVWSCGPFSVMVEKLSLSGHCLKLADRTTVSSVYVSRGARTIQNGILCFCTELRYIVQVI
jgi:hypothetical protein